MRSKPETSARPLACAVRVCVAPATIHAATRSPGDAMRLAAVLTAAQPQQGFGGRMRGDGSIPFNLCREHALAGFRAELCYIDGQAKEKAQ